MAKQDGAQATASASVDTAPADPRMISIVCSECGGMVDRVGYDAAPQFPPALASLMGDVGMSEKEARALLADRNPDALRTQEENARDLVDRILAKDVADRDADTYTCPNGHDAGLEVAS